VSQTLATPHPPTANLLAQYELFQHLGGGPHGSVHLARDRVLDQLVAIKLLRDEYGRDPDRVAGCYGLARAAAHLDHPNIVAIYDHGISGRAAFITMEYVAGHDLATLLASGDPVSPRRAATIVAQLLDALAAAHDAGLIHGTLHPHNVLFRGDSDAVVLTDFGLANLPGGPTGRDSAARAPYRAPELAGATAEHPAADLYAVGALFTALLALRPARPSAPIAPALLAVAARATAPDPAARYPTAAQMRADIVAHAGTLTAPLAAALAAAAAAHRPTSPAPATFPTPATAPPRRDRRARAAALLVAGGLVLGGLAGAAALTRDPQPQPTLPAAAPQAPPDPAAAVAPQRSAPPSTDPDPQATPPPAPTAAAPQEPPAPAAAPQPTLARPIGVAPQPIAELTATPAPAPQPSEAPAAVAPTIAPTAVVAAATPAPAPALTPTIAPATAPTPAPTSPPPPLASVPPVAYTATFGAARLTGAYRRNDGTLYGRPATALYGTGTGYERGTLTFDVPALPTVPLVLLLTGIDDESAGQNGLVVAINGVIVFTGPNTLPNAPLTDHGVGGADRSWGLMAITIPVGTLAPGPNTLTLQNTTPSPALGVPYILINAIAIEASR